MDNISVIIRNRNEEQYIGFAIQSILDHFVNPQIVVVDNNSTDSSMEVVSMFRPILKNQLKLVNINNYSPGAALNEGVKHCTNKIILILSAHAQITDMDFSKVELHLKRNNVAVFGNQIPIYRGKKITKRYIWSHFKNKLIQNMYSDIEDRYFLHNAFCFYEKVVLENNPFDENLQGKEDRYWAKAMIDKHQHYIYDPNLSINHFYTINGATWKGIG